MKIVTLESQAQDTPERWAEQYSSGLHGKDKFEIGQKLNALKPEERTRISVAEIIGNTTWCQPTECGECEKCCDDVVRLGPTNTEYDFCVCEDCLTGALGLLAEVNRDKEKVK